MNALTDLESIYSQVLHIRREYALLGKDRSALASLRRSKLLAEKVSSEDVSKEKAIMQHIQQKERSLVNDSLVQVGYLPLTMHWSVQRARAMKVAVY